MKKLYVAMVLACTLFVSTSTCAEEAQSGLASQLPDWLNSMEIHSFLSLGYVYNLNDPDSDFSSQRIFDFKHNQFRVDDFQLSILKAVEEPGDAGFRIDLDVGSNIPRTIHSAGLLEGEDIDLRQAYLSYNAPLGNGLTIDFGKFITAFGLEVIEGWQGFNDNYSRSYDFSFAIPFTHTGLRLSYPVNDKVSLMFMVVNGWDKVDDNNDAKGFHGQLSFIPTENISLWFNFMGSPEQDDNNHDWRTLFNVVWVVKPFSATLPDLTFSGSYDHGTEDNVGIGGRNADWHSVQGGLRYDFTPEFYLAMRAEWMQDEDGARITPGISQEVWAFTVTPTFVLTKNLLVRPEFRYDHSTQDVFEDDAGNFTEDTQVTIGVNAIYYF